MPMLLSEVQAEVQSWANSLNGRYLDFDGGYGADLLKGGFGSDTYLLGFDSDNDQVIEQGSAGDIDRVTIKAGALPKDVSLVRQGDDLLIELENVAGVLTFDTMLIKDHFLGNETGMTQEERAILGAWLRAGAPAE